MRLRLRRETVVELTGPELALVAAGEAPPTWYRCPTIPVGYCLSFDLECEPLVSRPTTR